MEKDILTNYFKVRNRELLATTEPNVYFITFILLTLSEHINQLRCCLSPCYLSFWYVIYFNSVYHCCCCVYPDCELYPCYWYVNKYKI